MTEQPTEQAWLGNVAKPEAYLRNGHLIPMSPLHAATKQDIRDAMDEIASAARPAVDAAFLAQAKQTDLWLDAEEQATRALAEIQDGNINAGIACLQAALAFAQNYRHSLTEETTR